MKKQIKLDWQTITFAAIVSLAIIFAASSPAIAQTTYKVGDRVETMSAGKWIEVKIVEVQENGQYYVVHNARTDISFGAYATNIRSIPATTQTNNQNNVGNQVQNQTNGNAQATNGGTTPTQEEKSIGARYGSRAPRTCEETKAPARGAITAALAAKYVTCYAEKVWSNDLYLVENVKVKEVGGGIPYQAIRGQYSWDQVDVKNPVYPIRGSLVSYQCRNLINEYNGPPDTNCAASNEPNAAGYCYKTTFGDWKCLMSDPARMEKDNYRTKVAPPKP